MSVSKWKSIVVVVPDPSGRGGPAVEKAVAVARRCGAKLTLLHTFMLPQPAPDAVLGDTKQIIAAWTREQRRLLEVLAKPIRKQGVTVRCVVEWDFPLHEAIVRHVIKERPDVLFVESHRRGRLSRWLLANTDWELIRACPCPLWFVRSAALPKRLKVLVAVDPRHARAKPANLDDRLLSSATAMIEQLGGGLTLAHAYQAPTALIAGLVSPLTVPASLERRSRYAAETARSVERLAKRYDIDNDHQLVAEGDTCDVLVKLTSRGRADVLLIGAVSRSRLERPVIGATAERVIDNVTCDLFIVKPAGFRSPVSRARPKT